MTTTPASGDHDEPQLVETVRTPDGDYRNEWFCAPPPVGITFRVIRDEWLERYGVRAIYEISLD